MRGPHARSLRILSEYLEPQARIRQNKVRGTIVFFGSARALAPEDLTPAIAELNAKIAKAKTDEIAPLHAQIERMKRMTRYYSEAAELSSMLTKHYMHQQKREDRLVVCSGAGPGIMEAANRGATEAGGKTLGLGISLPFEQGHNKYTDPKLTFEFHYFFMRKYWFMYLSRALVVFPGGFGTCDELFEVITLLQTHKVKRQLPIVLYGSEYWDKALNFDAMVEWGVISPPDLSLLKRCDTPQDAYDYLTSQIDGDGDAETEDGTV